MFVQWLARHPFLLRDLRRLRKKARLARFVLGPLCVTALLLIVIFALPLDVSLPGLSRVDVAVVLVALMHALSVLCATDPLGGWLDETAAGRVESLTLLPLAARKLAASAVERRLYLKLMLSALFLPFYVPLCVLDSQFILPCAGLTVLLALAAWMTAPLGAVELTAARNMITPPSSKVRQINTLPGVLGAFMLLVFLSLLSPGLYAGMREPGVHSAIASLGFGASPLLDIPLISLPLLLGSYVLRPEWFFRIDLPPILLIAVFAYCGREIRILAAARALRSEAIVITTPARRTLALMCPPIHRLQEDIPIRRLQIVRGLVFRLGIVGYLWPLIHALPSSYWNYILLSLVALGALTGIVQASSGSRSILLPGRIERFFRETLPTATEAGMVVVPRLAVRLFAEAIGWELLTVGIICSAGGVLPDLTTGQAVAVVSMLMVSLVTAEACAVGYTLIGIPELWKAKKDFPRWNSGALLTAGTPGLVLVLFFAPFAIPFAYLMMTGQKWAPIPLSWMAASPLGGWGYAIINPTAGDLYPALWIPVVVFGAWMIGLLLKDWAKGAGTQYSLTPIATLPGHSVKARRRRRVSKSAPTPVAAWVSGWLVRLKESWDTPFVSLEWARMQRKPGMVGSPVAALLVLTGAVLVMGIFAVFLNSAFDAHGYNPRWMTALWDHFDYLGYHPYNFGIITACAALFNLAVGPLFSLLGAAGTFDRHRRLLTLKSNLAFLLTTPLSDGELFWSMVKGALFGHVSYTMIAVVTALPLAVVSLLLGIPALFLLAGAALFVGVTLVGTLLLSVVSGCTGPERWRSFWVGMAPLALAASLFAVYIIPNEQLSYNSQMIYGWTCGTIVILLIFPISLGFFKVGLHGIHRYRAVDMVEG